MNAASPVSRTPAWVTLGIVAIITLACFNMAFVLSLGWMLAVALLLFLHPEQYRWSTADA